MQARETGSPLLPKPVDQFRDYEHADKRVAEFYLQNHTHQTLDFVLEKKRDYLALNRKTLTVWEASTFSTRSSTTAIPTSTSRRSSTRCRRPRRSGPPTGRAGSS